MTSRILPFFSFVLALGLFFAYTAPLWTGAVAASKAAIAQDTTALASAKHYVARENELAQQRDAIDPTALARLATFLPDSVDNVGLILDIDALAAHSGLALASIDVANSSAGGQNAVSADGTTPGPIGTIDLTLAATGTYNALQTFLAGVERSERLLDVRDITVKSAATGVYTYQVTLRLYWLR